MPLSFFMIGKYGCDYVTNLKNTNCAPLRSTNRSRKIQQSNNETSFWRLYNFHRGPQSNVRVKTKSGGGVILYHQLFFNYYYYFFAVEKNLHQRFFFLAAKFLSILYPLFHRSLRKKKKQNSLSSIHCDEPEEM